MSKKKFFKREAVDVPHLLLPCLSSLVIALHIVVSIVAVTVWLWLGFGYYCCFLACLSDAVSAKPHWYLHIFQFCLPYVLAHMAQQLSVYFVANTIATATGHVFESLKNKCFFTPH